MQVVNDFVLINKPATINVGWEGGLRVDRNTLALTGGSFNDTAHTLMVWNRIGIANEQREFSEMILTTSHQDKGEAVSSYLKTEKLGKAPGWAGCAEVNDGGLIETKDANGVVTSRTPRSGAMVGWEIDIFASGTATDPDGDMSLNGGRMRVALDLVGRDEASTRGQGNSNAQASVGLKMYANADTPWFRWLYGQWMSDYHRSGIRLVGTKAGNWTPERAIDIRGDHVVGVDFSNGNFQSVMRIKIGQRYSLDQFDSYTFGREGNDVVFYNNGVAGIRFNPATGEVKAKKYTIVP